MRLASGVAAALLLAACAHGSQAAPPPRPARPVPPMEADDEAAIRRRLALWVEQFNAGDYPAAATIWAPDLIGWMGGGPDDTYAREQESAQRTPPAVPPQFRLTVDEVIVSGDLAVVRDTWEQRFEQQLTVFKSFEVWRRQPDGQWLISRWIVAGPEPEASPPSAPPPPPGAAKR